jgi:hypothetical protein
MPKAYSNALLFLRSPVNIAGKWLNKAVLTGLAIIAAGAAMPAAATPDPAVVVRVCAQEGTQCEFTGTETVYYGAESNYAVRTETDGISCTNPVFGDPDPGVVKICFIADSVCAKEGDTCSFTGTRTVYYGTDYTYVNRQLTDGTPCTDAVFSDTVLPPGPKVCYLDEPIGLLPKRCAKEGETCFFKGTQPIYYGAKGKYTSRELTDQTACTNGVFGDSNPNVVKACYAFEPRKMAANQCAVEGTTCAFTGTKNVRYGAEGKFVTKSFTNGTPCTNGVFGDPAPGIVKACFIEN